MPLTMKLSFVIVYMYGVSKYFAGEWISGPVCMYIARYFANPDPANDEVKYCNAWVDVAVYSLDFQAFSLCPHSITSVTFGQSSRQ